MYEYDLESAPGGKALHYEKSEVETICFDELKKNKLLPALPQPVRIDRFFEKRFGITVEYLPLEDGVWGKTIFGKNGAERVLISSPLSEADDSMSKAQFASTLAHEAGHCLLHGFHFALNLQESCMCRNENFEVEPGRRKHLWHEQQANMCIGPLLMPRHLVQVFWRNSALINHQEKTRELAETFGVSLTVARIRLADLNILG